jgi:hypothetical protein
MRWMMVMLAVAVWGGNASAQTVVMCAKAKGGTLKQGAPIKLRSACKANELKLDAAALGLQGPAGQNGQNGQDGADGAPGTPGVSGVEIVLGDGAAVVDLSDGTGTATASCPSGKVVLGGGIEIVEDVGDVTSVTKVESYPVTTTPQGWTGLLRGNSTEDWHLRAWAICADAS